ncbi:hypothetical protein TNCV_867011 [Trichonephila clavipes]|nr:hypothetical protein TNCV_867011 [Trichonephila clavipes]
MHEQEQDIEKHVSLDPVPSEDQMTALNWTGGLSLIGKGPRAESDLRVSLRWCHNGLVGPYSDTVLVTSFSPGSSTCASRVRWLNPPTPSLTPVAALTAPSIQCSCGNFPGQLSAIHTSSSVLTAHALRI